MFLLKNKKAVVTGGGSGIGKAIAKILAKQGAHVVVIDLTHGAMAEVLNEITGEGCLCAGFTCDVAAHQKVIDLFEEIGPIDILVNNAGIAHVGKAGNTSEADFDKIVNVNIKGVYNCLHAAIPQMLKNKGGVIINMASIAAQVGLSERFAYSAAKGAVVAMTLSVAKDYLHENIRCNSISPARVHTPFVDGFINKNYPDTKAEMFEKLSRSQPIGRMGAPDEIAALALYLCSDEASFITGNDYLIDGGFVKLNS